MKAFIYTVPKSGTYLLAEFLERLGYTNTGYHVAVDHYLDTKNFDLQENATRPSSTERREDFLIKLLSLKDDEFAFGHIPAPLAGWALPKFQFICAYRNPRKTLISEFIDFRFRRTDLDWINKEACEDDLEAFELYLERHARDHLFIFSEMLAVATLYKDPMLGHFLQSRLVFVNFDNFLQRTDDAIRIAAHFGHTEEEALAAREGALSMETKTKAIGLDIDRKRFWTPEAERRYAKLAASDLVIQARSLGLEL